jgi:hypothetical protein
MADATLPDNLQAGTVIAAVSVSMSDGSTFVGDLDAEPASVVRIAGNNLVLARDLVPADGGEDTWTVTAEQDGIQVSQDLLVEIVPVPEAVEFDPPSVSLPDNAPAGQHVAAVAVVMSDGSDYSGGLVAAPADLVEMAGDDLVLARELTSADIGAQTFTVTTTG